MEQLNSYKKSLKIAWGYNDYNDWPIKFNSIMHLFIKEFSDEFVNDLYEALQYYDRKEIALKFNNPARIYRIIHSVIYGMKGNKLKIEEQRKIANIMLLMVNDLKVGSPFNENGQNLILNNISEIKKLRFYECDKQQAQDLQRFLGLMWAYTESIFFRAHDVTKEIHGLYYDNDQKILIREYYNLRPHEIWEGVQFIDYSSLRFIIYYAEELDITLDAYNHIYFNQGNYINNMLRYRIEADGKEITLEELLRQLDKLNTCIQQIHEWVNRSSVTDKINKYADIYWYRKKPLKDLLVKDWQVPLSVRNNIEKGHIDKRRIEKMTDREIDFIIQTLL